MQYDFSAEIDRRGTNSLKWAVEEDELPMWVADMDFPAAPEIVEAIEKKAHAGIYGYTVVPEEFGRAVSGWWARRHGCAIDPSWVVFCTGVVPAIASIIRSLSREGDGILLQPPVYNAFYRCVEDAGRELVASELIYKEGRYSIDWEDLEGKLSDPRVTMMILCNPHNPVGAIWDRETLERIGTLCRKHGVRVISDEIHCDLTDPGYEYTPFASLTPEVTENSVICVSPTKTFNLAGVQASAVIVPNEEMRRTVLKGLNRDHAAEPNAFAPEAAIAAFSCGDSWLDALREYLNENKKTVRAFLESELSEILAVPAHATYLVWLDCSRVTEDSEELSAFLREKTGLWVSAGAMYRGNGFRFLRMNIACPRTRLEDGLRRLKAGIRAYEAEKK